jgi:ubiquinone/menaquinone biosynthesis C-methylase UbiE
MSKNRQGVFRSAVRQICPPIAWEGLRRLARLVRAIRTNVRTNSGNGSGQDLDVYWEAEMAQLLETWGENNVWKEIQLLMVNCQGKVLDIACGTGKTMEMISGLPLDVYGCDISDLLIEKAIGRGIPRERLTVCDATKMPYGNDYFDYAYSIGSLEHFTEEGIAQFLKECSRTVRKVSYHMIPVSRSGADEGWLKTYQSFHNNSVAWWLEKFQSVFQTVYVLDSTWEDQISVGKWLVCIRNEVADAA